MPTANSSKPAHDVTLNSCVCVNGGGVEGVCVRVLPGSKLPSALCLTSPSCPGRILSTKQGIFSTNALCSPSLLLPPFPLSLSSPPAVYPSVPSPLPSSQMSRLREFTHFTSRGPSSPFSTPQSQNAHAGHLTGAPPVTATMRAPRRLQTDRCKVGGVQQRLALGPSPAPLGFRLCSGSSSAVQYKHTCEHTD